MIRTITVVFTFEKIISPYRISAMKHYKYLCDNDNVEIGDLLCSKRYDTPVQVINITDNCNKIQDGREIRMFVVDSILNKSKNSKEEMEKKGIMKSFIDKYKAQFIPKKDEKIKITVNGTFCIKVKDEYVGINDSNELVSYPDEMVMDQIPIYSIAKLYKDIKVDDIIYHAGSYAKVLEINKNGSLRCLSYSGYTQSKKEIKDFMLGQGTVDVIINMFDNMQTTGFNPMILALSNDDKIDFKELMMIQMMQGNNSIKEMNPMIFLLMSDEEGSNNKMFETMLMMQMMQNGGFNFGNKE